jgi:hypothetical protein
MLFLDSATENEDRVSGFIGSANLEHCAHNGAI